MSTYFATSSIFPKSNLNGINITRAINIFTVKSPALLFELSNTLKALPFDSPCADVVLNVVTLLLNDVEPIKIEIWFQRCYSQNFIQKK